MKDLLFNYANITSELDHGQISCKEVSEKDHKEDSGEQNGNSNETKHDPSQAAAGRPAAIGFLCWLLDTGAEAAVGSASFVSSVVADAVFGAVMWSATRISANSISGMFTK